jgi:hypothetical protein
MIGVVMPVSLPARTRHVFLVLFNGCNSSEMHSNAVYDWLFNRPRLMSLGKKLVIPLMIFIPTIDVEPPGLLLAHCLPVSIMQQSLPHATGGVSAQ